MKTVPALKKQLIKNLKGPLGKTSLSFALRGCFDLLEVLRQQGASWNQILPPVNDILKKAKRTAISVDTLRGIFGREERKRAKEPRKRELVPEPLSAAKSSPQEVEAADAIPQNPGKLMKGESSEQLSDRLQDAADVATALEKLKEVR